MRWKATILAALAAAWLPACAMASDFSEPWKRPDRAIVIDAYEYNPIDWREMSKDKRIVGFIAKGSDGMPPAYRCTGDETERRLCSALWKRYAVAKELFQSRRHIATDLGLEWGAYHLGRPGNPEAQADHFLDFSEPGPDDLIALDIEENDPTKWMSLEDAEIFARRIRQRVGRYPVLYTNGTTAQHIADNRSRYPILSRLPLWYARYKPEIGTHFPKGHWQSYALWQFASQSNCNARRCPYRVPGTRFDIDVNVASMSAEDLRKAWPFGELLDVPPDALVSVPVPVARVDALKGDGIPAYVEVALAAAVVASAADYRRMGERYPKPTGPGTQLAEAPGTGSIEAHALRPVAASAAAGAAFSELLSWRKQAVLQPSAPMPSEPAIDPIRTGGIAIQPVRLRDLDRNQPRLQPVGIPVGVR